MKSRLWRLKIRVVWNSSGLGTFRPILLGVNMLRVNHTSLRKSCYLEGQPPALRSGGPLFAHPHACSRREVNPVALMNKGLTRYIRRFTEKRQRGVCGPVAAIARVCPVIRTEAIFLGRSIVCTAAAGHGGR